MQGKSKGFLGSCGRLLGYCRRRERLCSSLLLAQLSCLCHAHSHLCFTQPHTFITFTRIATRPPLIKTGSVSQGTVSDTARSARHHALQRRGQRDAGNHTRRRREHVQKERHKDRGRDRRMGSSGLPRTLTHRLSLLSQTETSELKRRALFLAGL